MYKLTAIACAALLFSMTGADCAPAASSGPISSSQAPSPYSAPNAGAFAALCKDDQGSCADLVGNALMDKIQYSPTSHICLSGVNYADAVAPWILAHPETANMPVEDGIYLAIQTLYRCGAPNNY